MSVRGNLYSWAGLFLESGQLTVKICNSSCYVQPGIPQGAIF